MAIGSITSHQELPQAEQWLETVEQHLGEAYVTNLITEVRRPLIA